MSKYAEKNVDSTSKNVLGYVFAPLIIIAMIAGVIVWGSNAAKADKERQMVAYCVRAMNSYYNAFEDEETVYKTNTDEVDFIGDSDRYFGGTGFKYKFSVNRAVSNKGRVVYGVAYIGVSNKVAMLKEFVVLGDADELDSLRKSGVRYRIIR